MAKANKDEDQSAVTEKISKELAHISKIDPIAIFKKDGLTDVLAKIKKATSSIVPDLTTGKGRKEIASIAYAVSRSKTALDDAGKGLVAQAKKDIKLVDNERKRARDTLDTLRDDIRKPLNDWEAADEARIATHTQQIVDIVSLGNLAVQNYLEASPESLAADLSIVEATDPATFEEFEERASEVKLVALEKITAAISRREKYDLDQAELAELREKQRKQEEQEAADKAKREREEREDEIARQAAAQAEQAEQAQANAEEEARQATARAAQAERDKIAREQQAEADELARRERNTQHKGKLNREAVADLVAEGVIGADQAKKIVIAIAKGRIRNVRINY